MKSKCPIRRISLAAMPFALAGLLWACGSERAPEGEPAPPPVVIMEVEEIAPPVETVPVEPAIEIPVEEPVMAVVEETPVPEQEEQPATTELSTSEPFTIPLDRAQAASDRYHELAGRSDVSAQELQEAEQAWEAERESIMEQMTQGSGSQN